MADAEAILGAMVAFVCAVVAVGADAQNEVRQRIGTRQGTSVVGTRWGWVFMLVWGAVGTIIYFAFISYPAWAERAFQIEIKQNLLWSGLVVGLSAVLVFRTNLATVGTTQVGGEFAYTWSRDKLLDRINRQRGRDRRAFMTEFRPRFTDTAAYPKYFDSLHEMVDQIAAARPNKAEILGQLAQIKARAADPNGDVACREALTGVAFDYCGPTEVRDWGRTENYGAR